MFEMKYFVLSLLLVSFGNLSFGNQHAVVDELFMPVEEFIRLHNLSTSSECARTCVPNDQKECYFRLQLEQFSLFGRACETCTPNRTNGCQCVLVDGVERSSFTANRMIPGPTIDVCQGDKIIVDIGNTIVASAVTIHFHGILQRGNPFYDGAPYVTQCPIEPANIFRYKWIANDPGTHFWQSQVGFQKADGLSGPIVVRQPTSQDPQSHLYDYDLIENLVYLQDWSHVYKFEGFPGRLSTNIARRPDTILINGKGQYFDPQTATYTTAPLEVYRVSPNTGYRFRLINLITSGCPAQITIEYHKMLVISTDGHPIEPIEVDGIISGPGERYDFVIHTGSTPGTYWIHVKTLGSCNSYDIDQVAILQYESAPNLPSNPRPVNSQPLKVLNLMDPNCNMVPPGTTCVTQLKYTGQIDSGVLGNNVDKIHLPFNLLSSTPEDFFKPDTFRRHFVDDKHIINEAAIDNIVNVLPPSPLLSQYEDLDWSLFCDGNQRKNCDSKCRCTHIIDVEYDSIIELILVDEVCAEDTIHPIHLHGYAFHVLAVGQLQKNQTRLEDVVELDKQNLLQRQYDKPVLKDTVMIPSCGYAVIRFRADNRGFWLLHTHNIMHQVTGMSAILQVGSVGELMSPPQGFPRCGHFTPDP